MSRRSAASALAVVLAAGGASIASAGGDDHGHAVLRLTAKNGAVAFVDNGQPGVNRGDRIVADVDLFRGDRKVGQAGLDCALTRVAGSTSSYVCTVSAALPDGQLTFASYTTLTPDTQTATAAVTGGTGRYRRAHGEASLTIAGGTLGGAATIRLS